MSKLMSFEEAVMTSEGYPPEDDEPCLPDGTPLYPRRKPTREERLQTRAGAGNDTLDWEER